MDSSLDFDGIDNYDLEPSLDFDGMDDYDLESTLDFSDMEDIGEKNSLEPAKESDNPQELDKNSNPDDNRDQSADGSEEGNDSYENINSESTSTVLISDQTQEQDEFLLHDAQGAEEIEEINQDELSKEIEKELQEGIEAINQNLEKEADFINAHKEMVENARELDRERASEGEEPLQTEEEWEKEIENAAYTGEQLYGNTTESDVEPTTEEITDIVEPQIDDPIEKPVEAIQEDLDLEDLEANEIEQHQVEPFIEEALETEPEPMINHKELEQLQELDLQDQFQEVQFKEYIEDLVENQNELTEPEIEEEVEDQIDTTKEELVQETREDLDFEDLDVNEIEQHQVEPLIEEALETEIEPNINDKELENLHELDLEEQFQKVQFTDYIKDLVEDQNEKLEQEKESEIEIQVNSAKEEPYELLDEIEEERDEIEQHQVESAMEELLETEPEPIVSEKELENFQDIELEEQFQKIQFKEFIEELVELQNEQPEDIEKNEEPQKDSTDRENVKIARELEIDQVTTSEENAVEERWDHHQELEEILQQNSEIEQEALTEIEPEQENSEKTDKENYEEAKKQYTQQTGKRAIYAKKETKGFLQWLEQQKEGKSNKKEKNKKESNNKEQKKDEPWKQILKNWIVNAEDIDPELRTILLKLVENYDEHEKVLGKYAQLYKKAQRQKLSPDDKKQLKSLVKTLQKMDAIKVELILGIREMKRYLEEQYQHGFWDGRSIDRIRRRFYALISQQYKNLKEAQKREQINEIINMWIKNASKKENNLNSRAKLREIVANYNNLDTLSKKFMDLYKKNQYKLISKSEKEEFEIINKILSKLEPYIIQMFTKLRAIKNYLNKKNGNIDKKHAYQIFNNFFTEFDQISISPIFTLNFSPLSSKQIQKYEQQCQKTLEELCVQYALEFKNILIKEYGYNILELSKKIPLTTHFGFRLDGYIRKVTNAKRDRAVSVNILDRVRRHIIEEFKTWDKNWVKEASFKRIMDFIEEYKEFSLYVSGKSGQGKFSISNIRYGQNSKKLAPKSWLIENLRYLFPKKFGLPIHDNLLSGFIFGDTPSYGRVSKLKWTTNNREVFTRIYLSELLAIDYRVNKLTKDAFIDKRLKISDKNLESLKKSVSFIIYYYVFGGYHDSTYVSKTTSKNLEVGRNFFTIEYEVIRAIFFATAEANYGEPVNLETISNTVTVSDLKNHLYEGFGFGDDFNTLLDYFNGIFKNRPSNSSSLILRDAKEVMGGYRDIYRVKYSIFQKTRKHATKFQGNVHKEIEDFLGIKFTSEVQVRTVVKEKYISTINDDGVKEKILVHHLFRFDGYFDLNKALKDYLRLDQKWMGIAFEAMGTYWHGNANPNQQEADRKKRLICREMNIILLEIPENMDFSAWSAEVLRQFKKITGVEIPQSKLSSLGKYLGTE